ncbi:dual specificity protein phosphatase family protein [Chelativorans sp. M5D2P16]|uniref:dual specificity protein phosphatase family protein n=1 Tax=Chelativorans sp. M5D2P16 TaxID=3095678 RepID=UPI002ACA4DC8|nr:dual specificity protein phosphatase family protein [Chelativorans sp. M5D2P16]MDZ5697324.1 dual specificity protein phosphatase family protein [Chelativorans sp. M5D2P16]
MYGGFLVLSCLAYLGLLQLTGNFHTVIAGELYRSAQPSAHAIAEYRERYGIRTIVNLRGESDSAWYTDEMSTAARLGITHIDFPMSASRQVSLEQADALVATLRNAPKPILIHCKAGADRTGLAIVIYLQQLAGVDEEAAEWQLSPLFGHVGIPWLSPTYAMDESWESLEETYVYAANR